MYLGFFRLKLNKEFIDYFINNGIEYIKRIGQDQVLEMEGHSAA